MGSTMPVPVATAKLGTQENSALPKLNPGHTHKKKGADRQSAPFDFAPLAPAAYLIELSRNTEFSTTLSNE